MGENGQAPIKKGIENTVEHGTYQCLMPPTGLPEPSKNARFKQLRVKKDNAGGKSYEAIEAFSSLSDLTALWPYLDDQQRETVLDVARALAKANTSTPSTVNTSEQTPVKPR